MATEKTKFETVDQYIRSFPEDLQLVLTKIRQTIRKAVPETEETISYQIPAYKYNGAWVIGFSMYSKHLSLACPPPFTVFDVFKEELSPYKQSKSAIQFPLNAPVPVKLIGQIARFRLKESKDLARHKTTTKPLKNQKVIDLKTQKPGNIDEYISSFPEEVREILQLVRTTVQKAAPGAEETIKYDMPTFMLNGNLVFFAAFKKHIGFYGAPTGNDAFPELSAYKEGKGSLQFPLDQPMPLDLITRIVQYRVKKNSEG